MLSEEPVRIRRDWDSAVIAECDFCSHSGWTVAHSDSGKKICASCCDIEFLSNWQDYAKSLATELLSLREQLAELKALLSVVWMHYSQNGIRNFNLNKPRPRKGNTGAIPLFTAAKPAED